MKYFNIKKTFYLTVLIFGILQILNVVFGNKIEFNERLLVFFGFTMLYTFSLSFANSVLFSYLDVVFAANRFSSKRMIIGFVGSFLVSIGVIFLIHVFEEVIYNNQSFSEFIKKEKPANYVVSIVITFFVTLSIYAFQFYKLYQENKVAQQKVIAGTANAKFESLKNQIDPHFLFNSLNVLTSLIEENPENAQKFTTSLSKIYRYVLEQKDKELVPINEELDFAKTYFKLLEMRFEKSIEFEIPENQENSIAKVVPLSLQLLLENTIKHNIASEQNPLKIRIYIENDFLVVQNNLQKKEVLSDSRQGVGLQNIINRYAILTQRKVLIDQSNNQFTVFLPILTKQINIMEPILNAEQNAYNTAKQQVERIKGFYGNLTSYCVVIPTLAIINFTTDSRNIWFIFPMLGWGIGLLFHGLGVFGYGRNWEERKIQEILNKNNQSKTWN